MSDIKKLTGIILAGGESSRMGTDKGLTLLKGKPLVAYAIETLETICDQIIISANSPDYHQFGYPVQPDQFTGCGPIGGIYSGLKVSETERNLILSCDIPLISRDLINFILKHSEKNKVCIPVQENGFPEPLCAYYPKISLDLLEKFIRQKSFKLTGFLEAASAKSIRIHPGLPFYHPWLFYNLNKSSQLKEAVALLNKYKK